MILNIWKSSTEHPQFLMSYFASGHLLFRPLIDHESHGSTAAEVSIPYKSGGTQRNLENRVFTASYCVFFKAVLSLPLTR